jgi:hypothetical protein
MPINPPEEDVERCQLPVLPQDVVVLRSQLRCCRLPCACANARYCPHQLQERRGGDQQRLHHAVCCELRHAGKAQHELAHTQRITCSSSKQQCMQVMNK